MKTPFSITTLIATAGLLGSAYALEARAGEPAPDAVPAPGEAERLDRAADLLAEGKAVQAKDLLSGLVRQPGLSDKERDRATALLSRAARAIEKLGPIESSLQTAQLALESEDLVTAQRLAQGILDAPKATNEQSGRARGVLDGVRTLRQALQGQVEAMLASAGAAYESGRFDECRSAVNTLTRAGLDLDANQGEKLASFQVRLVEIAESRQQASAAMLADDQPGEIKERQPKPPAEPPPAEPPVDEQPAPPTEQPAPPTEPAPQPSAQPSADQVILASRKVELQATLAEAELAFNDRRLNEALAKYHRIKGEFRDLLEPDQAQLVDNRIAECRVQLGRGAGSEVLGDYAAASEMIRSNAKAEFEQLMTDGERLLDTGALDEARNKAAQAMVRLNQSHKAFGEAEYQQLAGRQKDLLAKIQQRDEQIRIVRVDERTRELQRLEEERKLTYQQTKERKIRESLLRVRALQMELKYDEALQVIDNILSLDPLDPSALTLRDVITDAKIYRAQLTAERELGIGFARNRAENFDALVPPKNMLNFPDDWAAISNRRGSPLAFVDSPENRRTLAALESKRIPVAFKDNSLKDVLEFVQAVTQLNVDVDWPSLEAVGVDKDRTISLNLTNVPVRTVLDRVIEKASDDPTNGAAWAVYDGVLTVASREQINKNKVLEIYDIRDLLINITNFTNAPEFDLQAALQSRKGGGGGQSPFRDAGRNQQQNQGPTIQERTDELIKIVTTNVDKDGWQENGGNVGYIQQFQGNLIITNTPANHRAVQGLLQKLRDYRALQLNVETRFLLVNQNWFEQIGVDIDLYFNARNNQVRTLRATRPDLQGSDVFNFTQGGGLQRDIPGRTAQNNLTALTAARTPLPSPLSVIGSPQNSLGIAESLAGGGFANRILQQGPALGVAGQFLDDIQVDFLVKATQADQRSVTLTAPRLTLTNGQISNFYVATQRTYISQLQPVTAESAVGFQPDVDVLSEGVVMTVEGTVSADRRYVTLTLDSSIARTDNIRQVPVTAVAGGRLVNSADTQSFIELPTSTVTRVQTTISCPDQGTILLGGQRLITEQESEAGVPVLSKIPLLNRFFTNRVQSKEEQTLLILLKPTVIIQNEEEERAFPGLNESIRTGFGG